ncbi:hypothetical protein BJQ94_04280 [Cryobacterium sp. SO2]|uniref:hypothetical protein n=1 Tax=Cryobacterium sp. SO2 TaxID=1897060 RepID=UPI00223D505D|nr:hypothetical protein [Cryobacterium sp. SO2]WEO78263.1 hypothetical protein BJQ94_04280 [Cryobacterium sp. SO2]
MSTVHATARIVGRSSVVVILLALVLSGCSGAGATNGNASATAQLGNSADAAATQAPTPAPTAEPTGCPANSGTVPDGAVTAEIADIDGDGENDTEWYSEATVPFEYGITTASGATITLADGLAGPNSHSGWTAQLHNGVVVTVLDDGRGADLYAFVECAFVTPIGVDARPYAFDMQNLRGYGTGVGCLEVEGGLELNGLQVTENRDGSYALMATGITVSDDGLTAMNGYTAVAAALAADDRRVVEARTSSCADTPVVSTSGR